MTHERPTKKDSGRKWFHTTFSTSPDSLHTQGSLGAWQSNMRTHLHQRTHQGSQQPRGALTTCTPTGQLLTIFIHGDNHIHTRGCYIQWKRDSLISRLCCPCAVAAAWAWLCASVCTRTLCSKSWHLCAHESCVVSCTPVLACQSILLAVFAARMGATADIEPCEQGGEGRAEHTRWAERATQPHKSYMQE